MINMPAIVVANAAGILLMLVIAVNSTSTARSGLLDDRLFNVMVAFTIFECFLEPCTFFLDGRLEPELLPLNYVLNVALYVFNILFAFAWAVYADYKVFEDVDRIKRVYPFVAIPALLICLGALANLFTPVFFTISDANVYARTSLYVIPYAVTYCYLIYGVAVVYLFRDSQQRYLFLPAAFFMVPILIGSILQFWFYGLSLVWLGVAIGMVSMYVNVQNAASSIDQLSGLYSRQYFMNRLRCEFRRGDGNRILAGIMLDIDRFKLINDTFGHQTGDEAIEVMGDLLRTCTAGEGHAVRYAGDEFVIVLSTDDVGKVTQMIERVRAACEELNESRRYPFTLGFSVGYTRYEGASDSVDRFLERMDAKMYEDKRRRVEATPALDRRVEG